MCFFHTQMDNSDGNDDEGGGGRCGESMWECEHRQLLSIILFTFQKFEKNEDNGFFSRQICFKQLEFDG